MLWRSGVSRSVGQWWARKEVVLPVLWAAGTIGALPTTIYSLRHHDFDGLNNFWQIPFALPWVAVPGGGVWTTPFQQAWMSAAYGLLNAVLLRRRLVRRKNTSLTSRVLGNEIPVRRIWLILSCIGFLAAAVIRIARANEFKDGGSSLTVVIAQVFILAIIVPFILHIQSGDVTCVAVLLSGILVYSQSVTTARFAEVFIGVEVAIVYFIFVKYQSPNRDVSTRSFAQGPPT
jgi:hypothetical protein